MSSITLGLGLGPVAGGAIVQYGGWHTLFAVTGLTLLLIPAFFVLIPKEKLRKGSFDALGALLIGLGTTGLLLFLTTRTSWTLAVGVAGIILFAMRIRKAANPFVMPALFGDRLFLALGLIGIFAYMVNFSFLYTAPQILSRWHGLEPGVSGLVLFPGSVLAMLVSNRIGFVIDKYGNRQLLRYAPWCFLASVILMALSVVHTYFAIAGIYMLLSTSFTSISSAVSNELSRWLSAERVGAGMGLFQLTQFFSGAFGVALSSSAMEWQQTRPLDEAFETLLWGMACVASLSIVSAWTSARIIRKRG
jgi:DHA2 family metal-tetracycline-proton antiporter-like MFS transporter